MRPATLLLAGMAAIVLSTPVKAQTSVVVAPPVPAPPSVTVNPSSPMALTPGAVASPSNSAPNPRRIRSGKPVAVPSIDSDTQPMLSPPPALSDRIGPATLTSNEKVTTDIARQWMESSGDQATDGNGAIVFTYGSGLPSIVCAPLYECAITLQPGEVVNDIKVADAKRWSIELGTTGSGQGEVTHVVVKPHRAPLSTNMLIMTDRRVYSIKLVGDSTRWTPLFRFEYPEDLTQRLAQYKEARQRVVGTTLMQDGAPLGAMDFGYSLSGDAPWKPLRVYTDGQKTYIQFPKMAANSDLPVLVALGSGDSEETINYRSDGDRFVVDGVLQNAELLSGVGDDQQKVTIARGKD